MFNKILWLSVTMKWLFYDFIDQDLVSVVFKVQRKPCDPS